jgi:hypothetical protein
MSDTCRSCQAPVLWLENLTTGKRAPIDAEGTEIGNIVVNRAAGTYRVISGKERDEAIHSAASLHTNHFATCPQSAAWKQRAKAGR